MTSLLRLPTKMTPIPPVTTTELTEVDILKKDNIYIRCSICGLLGGTLVKLSDGKYRHDKCPRGSKW